MKKKLGLGSGVAICVGLIVATSCLVSLGTDKVGSLFKIRETLALDTFANSAISFIVAIRTSNLWLFYHLVNLKSIFTKISSSFTKRLFKGKIRCKEMR